MIYTFTVKVEISIVLLVYNTTSNMAECCAQMDLLGVDCDEVECENDGVAVDTVVHNEVMAFGAQIVVVVEAELAVSRDT